MRSILLTAKFKAQVNEIDDLWNDLLPLDESLNLADCSLAMELSLVTGTLCNLVHQSIPTTYVYVTTGYI